MLLFDVPGILGTSEPLSHRFLLLLYNLEINVSFLLLKGASIIRMLQFYLGRNVFLQGLTVSITSSVLTFGEVFNRDL